MLTSGHNLPTRRMIGLPPGLMDSRHGPRRRFAPEAGTMTNRVVTRHQGPHRFRPPRSCIAGALCLTAAACVSLPGARPVEGLAHVQEHSWDSAPVPARTTVPATLDNGRLFVTLVFRRPDGSTRPALVWVNMGMGGLSVAPTLRDELGRDRSVSFSVGAVPVTMDAAAVLPATADDFAQQLGPMPVEAILPAGVLRLFRVTLDYAGPSLTLAQPSDTPAAGVAVPVRVNEGIGLISAEAEVDGHRYPVVIDAGAGYSWWRGNVVRGWLAAHPDWLRAIGAAGRSNQAMVDQAFEQEGTLVRVPVMALGPLRLHDVGLLGSGPAGSGVVGPLIGRLFWNAWEKGAPGPVAGWLGGNVLSRYRITVDYRNRVTYWEQTAPPHLDELDAVGLSLVHTPTQYRVGGPTAFTQSTCGGDHALIPWSIFGSGECVGQSRRRAW